MYEHQIILSSSYSTGTRIGLHYTDCDEGTVSESIKAIEGAYDGKSVSYSIHVVTTESIEWGSVVEKDPYFDDVKIIDSVDDFITLIRRDRYLTGVDVARYILSKGPCSHTRLEKLTYMCYADYLCDTGDRLFTDDILAYAHGPIVDSVFERYSGSSPEGYPESDPICEKQEKMPIKSRIMFSEDGTKKARSIDISFDRYDRHSTEELVAMTHREMTPWAVTEKMSKISDDDIRKYHGNEI